MDCSECSSLERLVLEWLVFADKAETALRCYLITHEWSATVSDVDEYQALRAEQQRTIDERHKAFMDFVDHKKAHQLHL